MHINGFNNNMGYVPPATGGVQRQENQTSAVPSDKVDFSDGVNNPVELAVLPSVDFILGQAASTAIKQGQTVKVEGKITQLEGDHQKELAQLKYEMKPDNNAGTLTTTGSLVEQDGKGTFIKEKTLQDPQNPYQAKIQGSVSTDENSQQNNEELVVIVGMGSFGQQGRVNGFQVQQQMSLDFYGNINMQGNIAGTPYVRRVMPDYQTGGSIIQGQMGNMQERGKATILDNGEAMLVERKIGPYQITQKITFQGKKQE